MRVDDLFEGISDVLYHVTGFQNLLNILSENEFQLRPTFAKRAEQEQTRKRSDLYYMSTARSKNSKYIQDSRGAILRLDGRKLKQRYSGYGMDYWGAAFRSVDPATEQEDRIFTQNPTIPNAKQYIDAIDISLEFSEDQAERIFKIYSAAKKSGIPVNFYDSKKDRNLGRKQLPIEQVLTELKRGLDKKPEKTRPYTPPRRPFYEGDSVLAIFLGLRFDPSDNIPADVKKRIDKFLRKWQSIDKGSINSDFQNAVNDSQGKHRKILTQIVAYMKKNNLQTISDLGEYVYDKWIDAWN